MGRLVFSYGVRVIYRLCCTNRRFFGETRCAFLVFAPPTLFYDVEIEGAASRVYESMNYVLIILRVNDCADKVAFIVC